MTPPTLKFSNSPTLKLLPLLIFFLLFAAPSRAADFGPTSKIALTTFLDATSLPASSKGNIALQIEIAPGWHIQSAQPHDANLIPTRVITPASPGITFSEPLYPQHDDVPDPAAALGELSMIAAYQNTITILVPFTIPADAKAGTFAVKGKITTQACSTVCYAPVTTPFELQLTITAPGTAPVLANQAIFETARKQKFLPPKPAATQIATTATAAAPPDRSKPGKDIHLLAAGEQIALINARDYHPFNDATYPLPFIILFALAGGAILNIMPCVLPVIPLKVLALVQQAHGDRRLSVIHGLTFSAGVISLFVILAIILRVLGLFYGQQFQSPWFVIAMALLVLALALSMLGVWTIQTPQAVYKIDKPHTGFLGSYSSGLLATLLATPCSGPFLGPVLAWALVQPAWITALTLALVGVGMSFPYLILAAFPQLLSKMPKAGRWSELLKQGLGIVMIGVSIYLILVLPNALLWPYVLYAAVVLSVVCWAWGQIPTGAMEPARIWTIRAVALCIGIGIGLVIYHYGAIATRAADVAVTDDDQTVRLPDAPSTTWLPFNVAILDEALKSGRPVVVDWTANWCPNCHFLELTVLSTDPIQDAFLKSHAVLLKADESGENLPTKALKEKLGREAIPVLAIFSPTRPYTPVVLDSYSVETVRTQLQNAQAGTTP